MITGRSKISQSGPVVAFVPKQRRAGLFAGCEALMMERAAASTAAAFAADTPITPEASPDGAEILGNALESPVTLATNFSARITGLIIPLQTGACKFRVASAGESEPWLSSDGSPAIKIKIATVTGSMLYRKWSHINEAESQFVTLAAGRRCGFELRQWQRGGSTQLHVRWQLPGGTEERPIPAFRFALPDK